MAVASGLAGAGVANDFRAGCEGGRPAAGFGGIFEIHLNDELLWSRAREGRFPEAREIKQRVRDRIDPDRDLGHIDRGQAH